MNKLKYKLNYKKLSDHLRPYSCPVFIQIPYQKFDCNSFSEGNKNISICNSNFRSLTAEMKILSYYYYYEE